jgi:glucose-6-phosphate 1-dehydrogenase
VACARASELSFATGRVLVLSRRITRSQSERGWNRVVIEKPFGRDSETSAQLSKELAKHFSEDEVRSGHDDMSWAWTGAGRA